MARQLGKWNCLLSELIYYLSVMAALIACLHFLSFQLVGWNERSIFTIGLALLMEASAGLIVLVLINEVYN